MTTRQLKVSDDQQGDLRQNLYDGTFSILLEYNLPSKEQPLLMALEPGPLRQKRKAHFFHGPG